MTNPSKQFYAGSDAFAVNIPIAIDGATGRQLDRSVNASLPLSDLGNIVIVLAGDSYPMPLVDHLRERSLPVPHLGLEICFQV